MLEYILFIFQWMGNKGQDNYCKYTMMGNYRTPKSSRGWLLWPFWTIKFHQKKDKKSSRKLQILVIFMNPQDSLYNNVTAKINKSKFSTPSGMNLRWNTSNNKVKTKAKSTAAGITNQLIIIDWLVDWFIDWLIKHDFDCHGWTHPPTRDDHRTRTILSKGRATKDATKDRTTTFIGYDIADSHGGGCHVGCYFPPGYNFLCLLSCISFRRRRWMNEWMKEERWFQELCKIQAKDANVIKVDRHKRIFSLTWD